MMVINQNPGVTVLHPERLLGTIMLPGVPAEEYSHPSPEIQANLHTYCCSYCSSYANENNHRQQNRMLSASQCVVALNILNVLHNQCQTKHTCSKGLLFSMPLAPTNTQLSLKASSFTAVLPSSTNNWRDSSFNLSAETRIM